MKTFGDLKAGDKIFSFNKDLKRIFIDEITAVIFNKYKMIIECKSIISSGELPWDNEFTSSIENKYLNKFYMESASSFISADEKLFFDYINENI